jgi:drug/metabolite transporter (DMT)-like permease
MTHDTRRSFVGLGFGVLSALTFATSGTCASSLLEAGWSAGAAVTLRVALAGLILTPAAVVTMRGRWGELRHALRSVVMFGVVAIAGCQFCYFNALKRLDVGVALLLEYSGILLVVLWMWLRHGHRPRRLTITGGVTAILGLVLVLNPSGGIPAVGLLWAGASACTVAYYFIASSRIERPLPPVVLAWGGMVVGAVTLGALDAVGLIPFTMNTGDVVLAHHRVSWVVPIIGLSLVASAIAYAAGIGAARLLGAKLASFVGLTEVLFGVLFAWIALQQTPTMIQALGGIAVLAGIGLVRADETAVDDVPEPEPVPA